MAIGLSGLAGIRRETVWAEAVDTVKSALPIKNESMNKIPVVIDSEVINGNRGLFKGEISHFTAGGGMKLEAVPSLGEVWTGILGGTIVDSQPDAINAPTIYDHVISGTNGSILPSYFFEIKVGDTGDLKRVRGARLDSLSMDLATGQLLNYDIEVVAKDIEKVTAAVVTPALPAESRFTFRQGTISKDNVVLARVKNISFKFANGIDKDGIYLGGGGLIETADALGRDITMTADIQYSDLSLLDTLNAFTDFKIDIDIVGSEIQPLPFQFFNEIHLTMPKCVFKSSPHELSGKEILTASSEIQVLVDEVLGYDLQVTLRNEVTTYPRP